MTCFRTTRMILVLRAMVIGASLFLIGSAEAQVQQDGTPAQQVDKVVATQDTTPATTPATTPPTPAEPTWSAGPINFSGLVDGYYDVNFNHPFTMDNQLRNFDEKANQFSLNM